MIEILHYERANKNKIIGYVDVKIIINGLSFILRKLSHMQSGDKRWFNFPSFARKKQNGENEYLRFWQLEIEVYNNQILEKLSEKVKEYCEKNNIPEIQPLDFDKQTIEKDFMF